MSQAKGSTTGSRLAFALACMGHFHVDFMWGIWPIFKTVMQIDLAVAGLIIGLSSFLAEMLQVFWGHLSDKGYRFLILAMGLLLVNAFAFIPYFTPTLAILFLYFPVSLGSSAFHPPAAGIIGQHNPQKRGFNMSFFWSLGAVGLSVSQLVFTSLYFNHPDYFYLLTVPGFVLAFFSIYLFFRQKERSVATASRKFALKDFTELFRRKDTRYLWISQVMVASVYWGTLFLLPDILIDKNYPDWICHGAAHFCYVIGGAIVALFAGYIADRTSAKTVMLVGTILGSLCFYAIIWMGTLNPYTLLALSFGMGALIGQNFPLSIAVGNALVPERPALISGFLMGFVWFISETISMTGSGLISKLFAQHQATNALACLGVLFIPAIIALFLMPLKSWRLSPNSVTS
jgi:FSR family fosmidomycin resistance protein-like MFS transporter